MPGLTGRLMLAGSRRAPAPMATLGLLLEAGGAPGPPATTLLAPARPNDDRRRPDDHRRRRPVPPGSTGVASGTAS
ncbi:MAG TPA: hypothetical protein VLM05_02595 [Mycobacteriales bacterium]|nr:hypothetical protein [Mycobacteriales bacterium]